MHRVIRTGDFDRALEKLPKAIRELAARQLAILASDWHDPRLHLTKLREQGGTYAFRITRNYRGQFYFDINDSIIVFDIDHRKDAYRKRRR